MACTASLELTTTESQIVSMVNGTGAYDYDLEMERIAYNHALSNYSFRSAGSRGANATAEWLVQQFEILGLETRMERFQFTTWEVLSKPTLVIDEDNNPNTTDDQTAIDSFQSTHYSWPTPLSGAFSDLVVLPLPPAADYYHVGSNSINQTEWNAINITDKIVLVGREVRWAYSWELAYTNKLVAQTPSAVVYTWSYDWMSFVPDFYSSAGGRPLSNLGPYYWDLEIPVGFVNYDDGLLIRTREDDLNVSARVEIDSVIDSGSLCNVVAELPGTKYPDKFVIVSSHYDTVMCSSFCDNGAGTAGVLEMARIFAEANRTGLLRLKYTVLFVPFTGEEIGLVGAINYVIQHKMDMNKIVAVMNLDCIGSDNLVITETDPAAQFDLDELVSKAAADLGIGVLVDVPGGSDDVVFSDPGWANDFYSQIWGLNAGISDAAPVRSSTCFFSYPSIYLEKWDTGSPGWIHTSYDNSTSTAALSWVEVQDLENHLKVAALSAVRIVTPNQADINNDGRVDMKDIGYVARRFGIIAADPLWDPAADINHDGKIDMKDIGYVARWFGQVDP